MAASGTNPITGAQKQLGCVIIPLEADTDAPLKGDFERMARRRFQNPKPFRRGEWWCLLTWQDVFREGKLNRKRKWHKLAPATMLEREAKKIAAELIRPLNQGLESIGSATNFSRYVDTTYIPIVLPLMAKGTQDRYKGVIENYLRPAFGKLCLRDLTPLTIQRYFSEMASSPLTHESRDKIRDVRITSEISTLPDVGEETSDWMTLLYYA